MTSTLVPMTALDPTTADRIRTIFEDVAVGFVVTRELGSASRVSWCGTWSHRTIPASPTTSWPSADTGSPTTPRLGGVTLPVTGYTTPHENEHGTHEIPMQLTAAPLGSDPVRAHHRPWRDELVRTVDRHRWNR